MKRKIPKADLGYRFADNLCRNTTFSDTILVLVAVVVVATFSIGLADLLFVSVGESEPVHDDARITAQSSAPTFGSRFHEIFLRDDTPS